MPITIVIIGLSFSGLSCYQYLYRTLPIKKGKYQIILIDKKEYFEYTPSIINAFFNPKALKKLSFSYSKVLGPYIQGSLIKLTENSCTIQKKDGSEEIISFEYCVLGFGGKYNFNIRPCEETSILQRLESLNKSEFMLKTSKNILIIGSGPTAVEMAGYLVNTSKFQRKITLTVRGTGILKGFPRKAGLSVLEILKKKGVIFLFGQTFNNEIKKNYDLVIECTGNNCHASKYINNSRFEEFIDPYKNRLIVNEYLQLQSRETPTKILTNIYAIGDISINYNNFIKGINEVDVVPKAEINGEIVGFNIYKTIVGRSNGNNIKGLKKMKKVFDGYVIDLGSKRECVMVIKGIFIVGIFAWFFKLFIEKTIMMKYHNYTIFIWLWIFIHFITLDVFQN